MAKDDYYVLVARILVYLYARVKGKDKRKPEEFLIPMSDDFPVTKEYFEFVITEMERHGYIQIQIIKAWGGKIVEMDIPGIQITQEGIDYLIENSKVRKAAKLIPAAASIAELFV